MIVVDVNLLAYLLIPGRFTPAAEQLLQDDPDWAAPHLWRSELRNILATYVRTGHMGLPDALQLFERAADIMSASEYEVQSLDVLRLSQQSACSGYDCEYVALAESFDLPLVTADKRLAKAFPKRVRLLV